MTFHISYVASNAVPLQTHRSLCCTRNISPRSGEAGRKKSPNFPNQLSQFPEFFSSSLPEKRTKNRVPRFPLFPTMLENNYFLQLEGISDKDICKLDLPNGIPIVYRFPPCLLFWKLIFSSEG